MENVDIENVLIIDTETTGLEPLDYDPIEFACILYSIKYKTIVSQMSFLLQVPNNPAENVNKIKIEATTILNNKPLDYLQKMLDVSDVIVAHNADFDKKWVSRIYNPLHDKLWICTLYDIDWPIKTVGGNSLINLALAYGVPVVSAHRALTDCQLIAHIFDREPDLENLLREGAKPKKIYKANLNYEMKHLAKQEGFSWNTLIQNSWAKKLTEEQVKKLPFTVTLAY